jgi:hypothetical protein
MASRPAAIAVARLYLFHMLQRILAAGFIALCLPTKTDKLPSGSQWLREIKHTSRPLCLRMCCKTLRCAAKANQCCAPVLVLESILLNLVVKIVLQHIPSESDMR